GTHLDSCSNCKKQLDKLINISLDIDKIIPAVSKSYESDFIYRLFIKSEKESLLAQLVSVALVTFVLFFIITSSSVIEPDNYISLEELKTRAVNLFNEDFYSSQ